MRKKAASRVTVDSCLSCSRQLPVVNSILLGSTFAGVPQLLSPHPPPLFAVDSDELQFSQLLETEVSHPVKVFQPPVLAAAVN